MLYQIPKKYWLFLLPYDKTFTIKENLHAGSRFETIMAYNNWDVVWSIHELK
jgi:hypothetical protein